MISLQAQFDQLKCCVLVPTYNNASKLEAVIQDIAQYTHNLIVVNDGSTDQTDQLLELYPFIEKIQFQKNQGKGIALIAGMKKAEELGYEFAISIDSDGQHLAKDFGTFLNKLALKGPCMLVGARNMQQEEIPGGSSFGHKFSNFWYKVETGQALPDTQSGFRLYPVKEINKRKYYTSRYEFEIESLVRLSWSGIPVDWVPIDVLYPEDRISHFRKFWDFFRTSVLNSVLFLIAILWIKPRDLYRNIRNGNARKIFNEHILRTQDSNAKIALAIGFGFFMGIFPIWGFQMLVAVFLAAMFKLNKAIVLVAANISIPPLIPFILYFSYWIGGIALGTNKAIGFSAHFSFENVQNDLVQYYFGAVLLSSIVGVLGGLISYIIFFFFRKKKQVISKADL
ncbi:MAG: DUF2062 domain-containing protein [Bacteroidales bacterium]|nr:DUF2062 domain-containing protein [Bacteroidales bacterium]